MRLTTNWAGNHTYRAERLHRPRTLEQLQEILAGAPSVHVLGSRHAFNGIADAAELVSLEALGDAAGDVVVDARARTVTVGGAVTYARLLDPLAAHGLALHNLASLPHISVAGAVATATHGSGPANGNLATAVAGLRLVTSTGEIVDLTRSDPHFDGAVVGLGALGAVVRLTLDVQPAFEVRQRVFEGLGWPALTAHFAEIMSCGYSVSVFTHWGAGSQVWVKGRTDGPDLPDGGLFGAVPAPADRHPVAGEDPANCTAQLGRPGPWWDRLPHFRAGFRPSVGRELQSEYLVPAASAVEALEAVRTLAPRIRPLLYVSELRTVAGDRLWMSTGHGRPSVALHFTWRPEPAAVTALLPELEERLAPFAPRPHWGKLFAADASVIAGRYERHADFARLAERLDPRGAFRTPWLAAHVLGGGAAAGGRL